MVREGQNKWVTGESFVRRLWNMNKPDSAGGNEDYVECLGSSSRWNDPPNDYGSINGYIVEYEYPIINPDNGHYYQFIYGIDTTWTEAKTTA